MKKKVGLTPSAIISARASDSSVLKSIDANRPVRSNYPLICAITECRRKNTDFRNRAFAFLFADGANDELSSL
ncbi:hypothetical protein VPH35_007711 [Triticum aestivum]